MAAWGWHQLKAGQLKDRHYLIFCVMMMGGQVAAAIECTLGQTWGTLAVQIYFFIFTAIGGIQRYRQMQTTLERGVK